MAERGGFEPPVQLLTVQRFSKPPPSATRPSLRALRLYRNPISSARTTLLQHEMSLQGASIARLPARRQKREAWPQVLWHLKISARQLRRRRTVSLRPIGVFEFPLLLTNTRLLFPLKLRSAVPELDPLQHVLLGNRCASLFTAPALHEEPSIEVHPRHLIDHPIVQPEKTFHRVFHGRSSYPDAVSNAREPIDPSPHHDKSGSFRLLQIPTHQTPISD